MESKDKKNLPQRESLNHHTSVNMTQPEDEALRAALLLRDLLNLRGSRCAKCSRILCGHETLLSIVAGFKDAPKCFACSSAELNQSRDALREHLLGLILRRKCHHAGWAWANREEGLSPSSIPPCLWSRPEEDAERSLRQVVVSGMTGESNNVADMADIEWDAGDMGCGELVLELRNRLKAMRPGQVLRLKATDPGAPEDLPAWCRLTGHVLLFSEHPVYRIQRKET